ncbi:hypothetical protein HPB47_023897 [Ixodes persulcatus]|uniref:Uncharacterized protein n=1 Tax=Ixodes persulcatus TaxID=34615 RepID=A0AC60Q657_IXOPE|nr:hypothetical protein HPB47_023897 [Ixodes persulcatus]
MYLVAYNLGDRQRRRTLSSGEQLSELLSDDVPGNVTDVPGTGADVVIKQCGGNDAGMSLAGVVKKYILHAANTSSKLHRIDLEKPDNVVAAAALNIWFAAKNELRKIQKPSQLTVLSFKKDNFLCEEVFTKNNGKVTFEKQVDKRCKLLGSG